MSTVLVSSNAARIAAVAAVLCTACIPFPHRSYRTPVVHGRIVTNGQPAVGVPLRVIADPVSPCDGKHRFEARTDANGEFSFCPMPEFDMFLYLMMAHRVFRWNTCANVDGEWVVLHESRRYTLSDAGPRELERLDCDLGKSEERCQRSTDIDISPEKLWAVVGRNRCAGI